MRDAFEANIRTVREHYDMLRAVLGVTLLLMAMGTAVKSGWFKSGPVAAAASVNVTVDLSLQYQTLEGFGQAEPSSLVYPGVPPALSDSLRSIAIDKAFHQVGIN